MDLTLLPARSIADGGLNYQFIYKNRLFAVWYKTNLEHYGVTAATETGVFMYDITGSDSMIRPIDLITEPELQILQDSMTIYVTNGGFAGLTIEEYLSTMGI